MQEFFENLLTWLWNAVNKILPLDPFKKYLDDFAFSLPNWAITAKGWLNWFIPFQDFVYIFTLLLIALGIYYGVRVLLGWLHAVE